MREIALPLELLVKTAQSQPGEGNYLYRKYGCSVRERDQGTHNSTKTRASDEEKL